LEETFVARRPQLDALERDLLSDASGSSTRHWQLIGPRGSGKSHFTELLGRRLQRHHNWAVARLPEEHYQVSSVAELLEQIILRLEGLDASPFAGVRDPHEVEERGLDRLRAWRKASRKPVLVILENLGLLLGRKLKSKRDQARLREILMHAPPFALVTTATSYVEETADHGAPFYDFFQTLTLEDLTREGVIELVEARARWGQDEHLLGQMSQIRPRVDALFHFSGGNPRLVLTLYGILRHGITEELHTQLLKLLDEVTPYYQARLQDISPQMGRILTEMALTGELLTPAEIARRMRLSTPQVTANITKLSNERFVRPGGRPDQRSRYYELSDRLFRLWMQMREGRAGAQQLRFLTDFFQRWYSGHREDLHRDASRVAKAFWMELHKDHVSRCTDLIGTLTYLSSASPDEHGDGVLRVLNDALSLEHATDPGMATRLEPMMERLEHPEQRAAVSFALAKLHYRQGEPHKALAVLKKAIESDKTISAQIWMFYLHLLQELAGPESAYSEGLRAVEHHPSLQGLHEILSYLAASLNRSEDTDRHLELFLAHNTCGECRERVLLRHSLRLLQADRAKEAILATGPLTRMLDGQSTTVNFLWLCASMAQGKHVSTSEVLDELGNVGTLSVLPAWLLESTACILSHHGRSPGEPLNPIQFVRGLGKVEAYGLLLKSALELLVRAQSQEESLVEELESWLCSMSVESDVLARQFRTRMPHLAREPDLRPHVLSIYQRLRACGLLDEDIPPYSTAIAVQEAPSQEKALMPLHPELREAVSMLLGLGTEGEEVPPKQTEPSPVTSTPR
jgi:DNA-binding MarR family transcriptional regulator